MKSRRATRIATVCLLVAGHLVQAFSSPAATIRVPITLARTLVLARPASWVRLAYPATHVAFSWTGSPKTGVRYRTVSAEGRSPWTRVPESHGPWSAREHYSAVLAVGDATAVNWKPIVPRGARMGQVTFDYLNTLDGPRREVEIPSIARAATGGPEVVTRAQWGADESIKRTSGGCRRRFFPVQQIFVHHTAGANYDSRPRSTMRAIYWYHTVRQGWCDLGYNFVISPNGTIFEGRWARRYRPWETHDAENRTGEVVAGAHTESYNSGSVGISLMGNYSQVELPPEARRSLIELLAWETDRHDLDPQGRHRYRNPETGLTRRLYYIAGHRDAGSTECPGRYVYADLPQIRREVTALKGAGKESSVVTLEAASARTTYGEQAEFNGTLTAESGTPMPARTVSTYVQRKGGRWKRGPEAVTDAEGAFSFALEARANGRVVALYQGDAQTWGAQSPIVGVRVAANVTLEAEGGTPDTAGISHHDSSTEEVVLSGQVAPAHPGEGVVVRVSRLEDDATYRLLVEETVRLDSVSRFRYRFPIPDEDGGTYRAIAVFPGDGDHARGRSAPVVFIVDP